MPSGLAHGECETLPAPRRAHVLGRGGKDEPRAPHALLDEMPGDQGAGIRLPESDLVEGPVLHHVPGLHDRNTGAAQQRLDVRRVVAARQDQCRGMPAQEGADGTGLRILHVVAAGKQQLQRVLLQDFGDALHHPRKSRAADVLHHRAHHAARGRRQASCDLAGHVAGLFYRLTQTLAQRLGHRRWRVEVARYRDDRDAGELGDVAVGGGQQFGTRAAAARARAVVGGRGRAARFLGAHGCPRVHARPARRCRARGLTDDEAE
ncbi:hypothetical protein BAU08_22795 [Bordetella bronchialis]|uniref:Uncharacterized protein n=1 Tax=Bordetella bronchialis TaxID=463025 RepID=A0A193G1T3_9BORD|nr:hypothetical protein BAU06_22265 [Bordetella bronchialis]ANN73805.1 hypothetical protein BAU08_22795 [Bordetella bronchialis]